MNAFNFDRQQSKESGCTDFLAKPVQSEEQLEQLRCYLNLTWIYKTDKAPINSLEKPQVQTTAQLAIPSGSFLQKLYMAARIGDIEAIEQEAKRLEQLEEIYQPFVQMIL